jgi:hypothetical protein
MGALIGGLISGGATYVVESRRLKADERRAKTLAVHPQRGMVTHASDSKTAWPAKATPPMRMKP